MATVPGVASSSSSADASVERQKGQTVVKPVIYGNIARYFGKKREEDGHTHQWTVYVKPYKNEDMSVYVKKVHFKLHESYPDQNRVVSKPPYEVTETGWGEFEIAIKIFFHDSSERPSVTLYHVLKLFQSGVDPVPSKKPLVTEYYEEIIFQDPSPLMYNLLIGTRPCTTGPWKHETDFEEKKEKTLQALLEAKNKIQQEIEEYREKLKSAKEAIAKFKVEIAKTQTTSPANQDKS